MDHGNVCTAETPNLATARNYMTSGEHNLALISLLQDYKFYPKNIFIISYLAACYYMIADFINFKKYAFDLFAEFEKNKTKLQKNDFDKITLSLVKMLEEIGEVHQAIKLLKIYELNSLKFDSITQSKLMAQKLRLLASYNKDLDLNDLYQFSCQKAASLDQCYIDHECALMTADCYLFGITNAGARLERFINSKRGNAGHKRLLIFDLIYEALKRNQVELINLQILNEFVYLEVDPFEKFIWDLFLIKSKLEPHQAVNINRVDEFAPMNCFRILNLMLNLTADHVERIEIKKRIGFTLNGLSSASRRMLVENFNFESEKMSLKILNQAIIFEGKEFSTTRCPAVHKLLSFLASHENPNTDSLLVEFGADEFNMSNFSRLRCTVARANSFLLKVTGQSKSISVNKDHVKIVNNIQILKGAC